MTEGEGTPFNYIHKLLNYGYVVSKNSKTRSSIRWSADEKQMYFKGRRLEIQEWKRFVHSLLQSAEEVMSRELLFRRDDLIPNVNLNNIVEDPCREDAEYYFMLENAEAMKTGRRMLLSNMKKTEAWNRFVKIERGKILYAEEQVNEYEHKVMEFLELLCCLCIMTCGQSGRGTEITSLQYKNTMSTIRGILVEDGQIMLVTEYHKSQAVTDQVLTGLKKHALTKQVKIIPRFLPHRVSQLIATYLLYVLPFRQMISPETTRHPFLFGDQKGPWNGGRIGNILAKESHRRIGFRMTLRDYRQISIAMDRKFIREYDFDDLDEDDDDDEEEGLDTAHDLIAGICLEYSFNVKDIRRIQRRINMHDYLDCFDD